MQPPVYLETSFVSYLVGRISRDRDTSSLQLAAREWWDERRRDFSLIVSPYVIDECRAGDPVLAAQRIDLLRNVAQRAHDQRIIELQALLTMPHGPIPPKAALDAAHFAAAAVYGCEYLLTCNLKHIANGIIRRRAQEIISAYGIRPATICTPGEL